MKCPYCGYKSVKTGSKKGINHDTLTSLRSARTKNPREKSKTWKNTIKKSLEANQNRKQAKQQTQTAESTT
jgi:hypothetical protein